MCSWGMSTLLWPGRSGALGRDYISYGVRTSSSSRRHGYNRPAPLVYSVGACAGAGSGSGAYYGSRYHPSSSRADAWTPPPRVASFLPRQRGQGHGARSHHGHTSGCRAAADAFRNSSGGAGFDPAPSRRPSGQKRVHFADSVECVYPGGHGDQAGSRRHRRRGEDEDNYDYGRSGSRGDDHDHNRHDQAGHDDTYYDAYEWSPRAAIQRRNSTRLDEAGMEDTRRRASRLGRRGDLRSVKVEVVYS